MVLECAVCGCQSDNLISKDLDFYKFPSDVESIEKWLRAIKRLDLWTESYKSLKRKTICGLHFAKKKGRLPPNSCPTLNLTPSLEYTQKSVTVPNIIRKRGRPPKNPIPTFNLPEDHLSDSTKPEVRAKDEGPSEDCKKIDKGTQVYTNKYTVGTQTAESHLETVENVQHSDITKKRRTWPIPEDFKKKLKNSCDDCKEEVLAWHQFHEGCDVYLNLELAAMAKKQMTLTRPKKCCHIQMNYNNC